MSMMNAIYATLIVLILGAGIAMFLGLRTAAANGYETPLLASAELKE